MKNRCVKFMLYAVTVDELTGRVLGMQTYDDELEMVSTERNQAVLRVGGFGEFSDTVTASDAPDSHRLGLDCILNRKTGEVKRISDGTVIGVAVREDSTWRVMFRMPNKVTT